MDARKKSLSLNTGLIKDVTAKDQAVKPIEEKVNDIFEAKAEDTLVLPEQNDIELDESFTMDDDVKPSDEVVNAVTIEVNYADLKGEDVKTASPNIEMDKTETTAKIEESVEGRVSSKLDEKSADEKNTNLGNFNLEDHDDDVFHKSLSFDTDLINDITGKNQTEKLIEEKVEDLFENKIEDKPDIAAQNNIEFEDIDLLAEGIAFKEDKKLVIEEKESLLLDESFTMHDDLNPSNEVIYADTLKVNYTDLKDEKVKTESPNIEKDLTEQTAKTEEVSSELKLETFAEQIQAERDANNDLKKPSDLDLFSYDLESNADTHELIDSQTLSTDDAPLTLLDESIDADIASFESNASTGIDNVDTDLDSLLKEVSTETGNFGADEKQKVTEVASSILETKSIKDNFDNKNKSSSGSVSKGKADFDLQSLLNEVREEASGSDNKHKMTDTEKRWMQFCGTYKSISTQKEVAKISFIPENHLLKVLLDQIESVKGSEQLYRIKYNDLIIVIDHSENSIYCNLPVINDEFSEICFSEVEQKNIKIHDLDYSEVRLYRSKIKQNPVRAHTIESFIWSMSLLTSRGRLPKGTDVTKKVGLKVWPNLTRVELPPHGIHIAAVFSKNPGNLLDISEWLNIEQRYVFAFYNAALSLNMIELDSSKMKKPSFSFGKKNSKGKEERSFFGRLMKRLKS